MTKTVFITGCSSGIGKVTALYFQKQGWNVAATMRDPKKVTAFKGLSNVLSLALDVTQPHTIKRSIESAMKAFGSIDVLVNNAGIGIEGPFEGASGQEVEDIFGTNVFGLMNVTRAMLPKFRKQKHGVIVNISSMGGRTTFPYYSLYHATKWAVEGLSESLSYELASFNIRVKIIEPGVTHTEFCRKLDGEGKSHMPDGYKKIFSKVLSQKKIVRDMGNTPEIVARVVYTAACDESFRLRYPVGRDAILLSVIRKFFPDSFYTYLVRQMVK